MLPHQLIAALMHERRLKTNALATAMGKPKLQPSLHRFVRGDVREPKRETAEPLARFFGIPVEAIYSAELAAKVAKQRALSVVDWPPAIERKRRAASPPQPDTEAVAAAAVALPEDERRALVERLVATLPPLGKQQTRRA